MTKLKWEEDMQKKQVFASFLPYCIIGKGRKERVYIL